MANSEVLLLKPVDGLGAELLVEHLLDVVEHGVFEETRSIARSTSCVATGG